MSRIKAIFFDFDGTIADTRDICFNAFSKILRKNSYPTPERKLKALLGLKSAEIFRQLGVPVSKIPELIKEYRRETASKLLKVKSCSSLKPLKDLSNRFVLAIISNAHAAFLMPAIKRLKLGKIFSEVYSAEDFSSKDKMLLKLIKKHRLQPRECVYIGDRYTDVIYARRAGCISIAIHNNCAYSGLSAILKERPDFIIRGFHSLGHILKTPRIK